MALIVGVREIDGVGERGTGWNCRADIEETGYRCGVNAEVRVDPWNVHALVEIHESTIYGILSASFKLIFPFQSHFQHCCTSYWRDQPIYSKLINNDVGHLQMN